MLEGFPAGRLCCREFFGRSFRENNLPRKYRENTQAGPCKSPCAQRLTLFGGKMVLFSRSFIRKRAISLATTALVAATSFALAQDPSRMYHVRGTPPIQNVGDRNVADRPDYSAGQP